MEVKNFMYLMQPASSGSTTFSTLKENTKEN